VTSKMVMAFTGVYSTTFLRVTIYFSSHSFFDITSITTNHFSKQPSYNNNQQYV
jgi:hypothetical protein